MTNVALHSRLGVVVVVVLSVITNGSQVLSDRKSVESLSPFVHRFDTLHYEPLKVSRALRRAKRSVGNNNEGKADEENSDESDVRLSFVGRRRRFDLSLRRDRQVFPSSLIIEDENGNVISKGDDVDHLYEGHVVDEPGSHVFGSIGVDGVFDGQIVTKDGVFFVEKVSKYAHLVDNYSDSVKNSSQSRLSGVERRPHSVIYHERDVKHERMKGGCGIDDEAMRWMQSVQNGAVDDEPLNDSGDDDDDDVVSPVMNNELPGHKYSREANEPGSKAFNKKNENHRRGKRAITYSSSSFASSSFRVPKANPNQKKSCSLYIQTDPLFWRHIRQQESDDAKTQEEILSLIAQHVKAVNRIYSDTSFDGKYKHNGYQFEVQRIKIHNDSSCNNDNNRQMNQFCIPNVDVSNFLNLHSKSNHEEFCLAYVFTYRDFTGGTLGLAWVASASGASGGICETYKRYTENINGVHHTARRSLNTGIITFVNYNSRVPPKVSQLTLAHEIGHNFGSPHDFPNDCRPGGLEGNYIMFASATSGDRYNNNKFSHCSVANISAVLDAVTDRRKPNCFTESDGAFCGNKIVEEGEECDCGFDDSECVEECCYPRKSASLSEEENKRLRCTRRPGAQCSPSEGPCCEGNSCRFVPSFERRSCKNEDDCALAAVCNGRQAQCPEPAFKPDNVTECNGGTKVCQKGECASSICVKYGLEPCFLDHRDVKDKRELCELACMTPSSFEKKDRQGTAPTTNSTSEDGQCLSTRALVSMGLIPGMREGLSLRPGSPCDNFQGYCDVFLKCRQVDAEGPLVRLKNLLLNKETLDTITEWGIEYWWAVLLMAVAFVICMAIFIKCFAIHTPSSNPNLPKNLHFTETLRRPVRSLKHQGVYVGSWVIHNHTPPKHYRPAYGPGGVGGGGGGGLAPPPYPGQTSGTSSDNLINLASNASGGPGHGYGEGRGHYNRYNGDDARRGRRSRHIEMQPMR